MATVNPNKLPYQVRKFQRISDDIIQIEIEGLRLRAHRQGDEFVLPNNIPAEIADIFDNPQPSPRQTRRKDMIDKLQGLRGKTVAELSDAEIRELLEVILYRLKMLNPAGRITGGRLDG